MSEPVEYLSERPGLKEKGSTIRKSPQEIFPGRASYDEKMNVAVKNSKRM